MSQPWWVYGAVALLCVILIVIVKIIRERILRDDMGLILVTIGLGVVAIFTTIMMLAALGTA